MPQIDVRPRTVARPWDRAKLDGQRTTFVGREAHVEPDRAPLERYRSVFPERYLTWNVGRQLFEIRQLNPKTGRDERVELVFMYATPPDPITGEEVPPDVLEKMVTMRSPHILRVFRPFDHEFVTRRLREWMELQAYGSQYSVKTVAKRNAERQRIRLHDAAREMAAGMNELKRYFPVLSGTGEKVPLVGVGIDLRASA